MDRNIIFEKEKGIDRELIPTRQVWTTNPLHIGGRGHCGGCGVRHLTGIDWVVVANILKHTHTSNLTHNTHTLIHTHVYTSVKRNLNSKILICMFN